MSSIDSLTGIKNRNMMNNRVDQIVSGKAPTPEAVLFIDLNGLKRVNDDQGHNSGDKMLRAAAKILQEVLHDGEVFRAGGDEFMAMVPKITEAELQKRIEQVHKVAKENDIHFSIGSCLGGTDVRRSMHIADERMYADKNAYYEAHPEEKYR
jgi:diguanylate cyclase (GGDEF)-like protein